MRKVKNKKEKKITKAMIKKMERRSIKKQFDDWAKAVKDRDGWKCCLCGKANHELKENGKPVLLNAHHLVQRTYKPLPELRFDVDNGITLCQYCHKWSDKGPHHSPMYFYEWFKRHYPERYKILTDKLFAEEQKSDIE